MSDLDDLEGDGFGEPKLPTYGSRRRGNNKKVLCQGKQKSGEPCHVWRPASKMNWVDRVPYCHWHAPVQNL